MCFLYRFGALCDDLLPNVLVLLSRCMMDADDEVRRGNPGERKIRPDLFFFRQTSFGIELSHVIKTLRNQ